MLTNMAQGWGYLSSRELLRYIEVTSKSKANWEKAVPSESVYPSSLAKHRNIPLEISLNTTNAGENPRRYGSLFAHPSLIWSIKQRGLCLYTQLNMMLVRYLVVHPTSCPSPEIVDTSKREYTMPQGEGTMTDRRIYTREFTLDAVRSAETSSKSIADIEPD